jgi:hypothetical protein
VQILLYQQLIPAYQFLLIGILAQIVVMVLILAIFFSAYQSEMFQELLLHLDSLNSMSSRPYIMRWRVLLPFYFAATLAEVTVIRIAMNYLPSTVISILQYRSGALGTLHSSFFSSVSLSICAISASSSLSSQLLRGGLTTFRRSFVLLSTNQH